MASITPVTFADFRAAPTTATWINPYSGDFSDAGSVTPGEFSALRHLQFYFEDSDNLDFWASGIRGIRRTAIDIKSPGFCRVLSVSDSPSTGVYGTLTFNSSAFAVSFIVHVWSRR